MTQLYFNIIYCIHLICSKMEGQNKYYAEYSILYTFAFLRAFCVFLHPTIFTIHKLFIMFFYYSLRLQISQSLVWIWNI